MSAASDRPADLHWPIVFAAMGRAAETKDTDMAEAAARLVSARRPADEARITYESLRTYLGVRVGLVVLDTDDAPPTTPRAGPANDDDPAS